MVEGSDRKNGNGIDPYQFNPGKPFFGEQGLEGTTGGNSDEIPTVDPTAIGTGEVEGTASGNASDSNGNQAGGTGATSGRKPRSDKGKQRGPRAAREEKAFYLGGFENLLVSAHLMIAKIAECPEIELSEDEAARITRALNDLRAHYNVTLTETQQVWGNLILTAGAVYGPKALAIYARNMKPRKPATVTPIRRDFSSAFPMPPTVTEAGEPIN